MIKTYCSMTTSEQQYDQSQVSKIELPDIPNDWQPQINKWYASCSTVHHWIHFPEPRIKDIHTSQHTSLMCALYGRCCFYLRTFEIMRVSSASWRWDNCTSPCRSTLYPRYKLAFTKAFIKTLKPLAARRNKKGERVSPCLSPRSIENSSVSNPFTRVEAVAILTHSEIHFRHKFAKFIWIVIESI